MVALFGLSTALKNQGKAAEAGQLAAVYTA